ncbi:hypothetical protein EJ02DRAFT_419472 [Clathrospora elynae]|uniref:Uncharacterized protein n=1 Tax=Clathrospora elynae TaxID=706981 RepID=A0A6A5SXT4_9PLEO|nr:hypothetical protein EJ02DRAFT_419472 [Clathrospora elynae]
MATPKPSPQPEFEGGDEAMVTVAGYADSEIRDVAYAKHLSLWGGDRAPYSREIQNHAQSMITLNCDHLVLQLISDSMWETTYTLIYIPNGKTSKEIHLGVYMCVPGMGIELTTAFALTCFGEELRQDVLSVDQLEVLVKEYKPLTATCCETDAVAPDKHQLLRSLLASHITLPQDRFNGNDAFAKLHCSTQGHLGRYLSTVRPDLRPYQIRMPHKQLGSSHPNIVGREITQQGVKRQHHEVS